MSNIIFHKAKYFIVVHFIFQFIVIIVAVIFNTNTSFQLIKSVGIIIALNAFILIGIQLLMALLFTNSKILMLEIYSTLLSLLGLIALITILFSNDLNIEDKTIVVSMFETICISGLFNRFVLSRERL